MADTITIQPGQTGIGPDDDVLQPVPHPNRVDLYERLDDGWGAGPMTALTDLRAGVLCTHRNARPDETHPHCTSPACTWWRSKRYGADDDPAGRTSLGDAHGRSKRGGIGRAPPRSAPDGCCERWTPRRRPSWTVHGARRR